MRWGIDGLSVILQQRLGHALCAGAAFIFRNRAGNRLKLLPWDSNGVWLCQGVFIKSEGLTPLQRDVFEETLDTDIAAI